LIVQDISGHTSFMQIPDQWSAIPELTNAPDDFPILDRQLCFALYVTSRAMVNAYRPILDSLGLTYPQYLVMLALWEQDDIVVGELCDRLHLETGTLTPLLKRLELRGVITRVRDAKDERQVRLLVTAAGLRMRRLAASVPAQLKCRLSLPKGKADQIRSDLDSLLQSLLASEEAS
jgi:MarR family transcriptional regulator, organic hydroperoxide resistance regulator